MGKQRSTGSLVVGALAAFMLVAVGAAGCEDANSDVAAGANGGAGGVGAGMDGAPGGEATTGGGVQAGGGGAQLEGGVAGAAGTFAAAGVEATLGGAGMSGGTGGTDGGAGVPGGAGGTDGGASFGGASSDVSCVERPLLGTYNLQAHNERTRCPNDVACPPDPTLVEDHKATLSLYELREQPGVVFGSFDAPGITLGLLNGDTPQHSERWDSQALFYYPEPGETPASSADLPYLPANGYSILWLPSLAKTWVRVQLEACVTQYGRGFVIFDLDIATGKILSFARKCDERFMTFTDHYLLTGSGELACELNVCHDLATAPPAATINEVAGHETLSGGTIAAGTYHLAAIDYQVVQGCSRTVPPFYDTITVTPSSDSAGTISMSSQSPPASVERSTLGYVTAKGTIAFEHQCGPETFRLAGAPLDYAATPTQLKLRMAVDRRCGNDPSLAIYVYDKQ